MIKFNVRIRELREYLGMNKVDFAKKLGISPSTITRYEKGMDITASAVEKMADKVGVSAAWLLGVSEDMYNEDVQFKKIPMIGKIKETAVFDYKNIIGFEVLSSRHDADFCVKTGISETTFFKSQNNAENGDLIAALIDSDIIVRKYFKYGKQVVLRDESGDEVTADSLKIIGRAVIRLSEVK